MFATDPNLPVTPVRPFLSHKKTSTKVQQCEYCLKKQKLSDNDPNARCLLHSLECNKPHSSPSSSSTKSNIIQQAVELLKDVEEIIEEYWNNLHQYSGGKAQKVKEQLEPVFEGVRRVEDKLARFPFGEVNTPVKFEPRHSLIDQERKQTRSQRFLPSNFSELFQDTTINDQIKEWVIYFSKILVNRQIRQQLLPFDDEVDMHIFKQSMERRYITFAKEYDRYEKRLAVALEKLLFYMEVSGDRVSQKVLQGDIAFMQSSSVVRGREGQVEQRMLMMQALTIEDLLARTQC